MKSRVIVITGASKGIGAGLAAEFARHGHRLGLCARSACQVPGADPAQVVTESVDVVDETAVDDFAARVTRELGPIDVWINNAGVLEPIRAVRNVSSSEMLWHLQVNVVGVLNGTRAFAGLVRARESGGVLINISSGAGRNPYEGWGAYCAGKAAVDRLTEVVALEEKTAGLLAYAVAPGVVDTEMQEQIRATDAEDFPMVVQFQQMKRDEAFSTTADVAEGLLKLIEQPGDEVLLDLRK